ncbi:C-type lectin lectoxin-Enh6-like [Mercenaria mercenaria]|uniref:C-type lectin lectoxin-Enh6-like n=1 Tax=Mercenaria mercenaria TaxID=6596 RepID=UPI00234E7708|nr:C-type lectin lectoxin-Enh6-like [Mercenaria mercenaria]
MRCQRQKNFLASVFLFYLSTLTWTMIQSSFVSFQRISGSRFTSELGTLQVMFEAQCVHFCSITPHCSSVSFNWEHNKCELGSAWMVIELIVASQDWELLYRENLPVCRSGSCFELNTAKLTWNEANDYCKAQHAGGHLAHIKTESDQILLNTVIAGDVWIGSRDIETEGVFLWTDGTLISEGYNNWDAGQPDNYNGVEDCVMVWAFRDLKWNDEFCGGLLMSVCQYPVST